MPGPYNKLRDLLLKTSLTEKDVAVYIYYGYNQKMRCFR